MLTKPRDIPTSTSMYGRKRRRTSLWLIGASVPVLLMLIAGTIFVVQKITASHAATATPNPNCTLIIPNNPLTAQGLATPYQLVGTNAGANGPCNEANATQSAFVQAAIFDPATNTISAYEPLVIDQGTQPAAAPVVPTLPANAVVGIWFGFNGTILTQQQNAQTGGKGGKHHHRGGQMQMQGGANGNCVPGAANSPFGQFSYCNAVQFFQAANQAIAAGNLTVPPLGTTNNGQPCPTTRSFNIIDMDQSDNVQTQYLANGNGQIAQFNAANQAAIGNATTLGNPSDNALVTKILDPVLGCTPWSVPDLVNPGTMTPTLATDELEAAANQAAPVALVPGGDEMVLVNGNQDLNKTNLYRVGVDQPPAASLTGTAATDANTTTYCQNTINNQLSFLQQNMAAFSNQPSPDGGATANNLFTFLANRSNASLGAGGLNCVGLLNIQNPVALTTTNNVVTAATITNPPLPANAGNGNGNGGGAANAATGTVNMNLDTNAGNADVALNINIANFANKQFFVNVTDQATGKQVMHQMEDTDGNGMNAASTVINGLQGLTAIPATWVATITDTQGNVLGGATVTANGLTGTATITAASTAALQTGK